MTANTWAQVTANTWAQVTVLPGLTVETSYRDHSDGQTRSSNQNTTWHLQLLNAGMESGLGLLFLFDGSVGT